MKNSSKIKEKKLNKSSRSEGFNTHDVGELLKDPESRKFAFEQYKMLSEMQLKSNEVRENANNFWITINTLCLSAIAYIREHTSLSFENKELLIWTLIGAGLVICSSWLSYLFTTKKAMDIRSKQLIAYEGYFPFPMFASILRKGQGEKGGNILTYKEMFVPGIFLLGYIFFIIFFFIYPQQVVTDTS